MFSLGPNEDYLNDNFTHLTHILKYNFKIWVKWEKYSCVMNEVFEKDKEEIMSVLSRPVDSYIR